MLDFTNKEIKCQKAKRLSKGTCLMSLELGLLATSCEHNPMLFALGLNAVWYSHIPPIRCPIPQGRALEQRTKNKALNLKTQNESPIGALSGKMPDTKRTLHTYLCNDYVTSWVIKGIVLRKQCGRSCFRDRRLFLACRWLPSPPRFLGWNLERLDIVFLLWHSHPWCETKDFPQITSIFKKGFLSRPPEPACAQWWVYCEI